MKMLSHDLSLDTSASAHTRHHHPSIQNVSIFWIDRKKYMKIKPDPISSGTHWLKIYLQGYDFYSSGSLMLGSVNTDLSCCSTYGF